MTTDTPTGAQQTGQGAKHTPEPWRHFNNRYIIAPPTEREAGRIIGIIKDDSDRSRAVACVNACAGINPEAVPDLLAALRDCIEALSITPNGAGFSKPQEEARNDARRKARAAIAKAEGRA